MSAQPGALPPEAPRSPPAFNYDPILKIKRSKDGIPVPAASDAPRNLRASVEAVPSFTSVPLSFLRRSPGIPNAKKLISQEEEFLLAQRTALEVLPELSQQLKPKIEALRAMSEAQDEDLKVAKTELRELQKRRFDLIKTPRLSRSSKDRGTFFLFILLVQWVCCIVLALALLSLL